MQQSASIIKSMVTSKLKSSHGKFIKKKQDGTYKQLKEKLILIGGVLPVRQIW